jgi:hypothetical protein
MWTCQLCDKPFSKGERRVLPETSMSCELTALCPFKDSSYKRHVSYCRQSQGRPRVRPKSCRSCNAAKVKCTFQTPCRRCADKGLECTYEVSKRTVVALQTRHEPTIIDVPETATIAASQESSYQLDSASRFVDLSSQDLDVFPQSNPMFPADDVLTETRTAQAVSMHDVFSTTVGASTSTGDMVSAPPSKQHLSFPPWMWSPASIHPRLGHTDQAPWSLWTNSVALEPTFYTPHLDEALSWGPDHYSLVPTLQPLRSTSTVAQHKRSLIIQGLRSYPLMMLRRETFPPFIHPHWHRQWAPALPEPLSSCMSIAHMFAFRNEETRPFIWRTVKAEDERFLAQVLPLQLDFNVSVLTCPI